MTETKRGPGRPKNKPESARPQRTPLGVPRSKLSVEKKDPNYNYRWINDIEDRVYRATEAGYEFVAKSSGIAPGDRDVVPQNADLGNNVSKIVGTTEGGRPMTAYLMRIKKSFYEEDQKAKAEYVDSVEAGVRNASALKGHLGEHGYVKSVSIKRDS